ncbi:MAG: hypothetical protein HFG62_00865 [Lachnospiraceae bacterium]|nr:hypothetical protein [Lachnospiraceae bacterium]
MKINARTSLDIPIQSIQEFELYWKINDHAQMMLQGILEDHCDSVVWQRNYCGSGITIHLVNEQEEDRNEGIFFDGLIQNVTLTKGYEADTVCMKAGSASIKLDEEAQVKYKSFQDPSERYSDVARCACGMLGSRVIYTAKNPALGKPVICYKETVWKFLMRLASYQESYLIPDIKTGHSNLWLGMREGQNIQENVSDMDIKVEIKKRYMGQENGKGRVVYILRSRNFYSLGDWLWINERKCVVFELVARLEAGELWFTYKLSSIEDIKTEPYYLNELIGMNLWGTVEEAENEAVRVTFDMDEDEGKWFYPWRPENGNALYAMPEKGAKVAVCFLNHEEGSGIAIRCLGEPPKNQKPKDKSMTTPEEAKIELFTSSLNISKKEETMALKDSNSIRFGGGQIEIEAAGKVIIKAEQIFLNAASEIKATVE